MMKKGAIANPLQESNARQGSGLLYDQVLFGMLVGV